MFTFEWDGKCRSTWHVTLPKVHVLVSKCLSMLSCITEGISSVPLFSDCWFSCLFSLSVLFNFISPSTKFDILMNEWSEFWEWGERERRKYMTGHPLPSLFLRCSSPPSWIPSLLGLPWTPVSRWMSTRTLDHSVPTLNILKEIMKVVLC